MRTLDIDSHGIQHSVCENFVTAHDHFSPMVVKTQVGADSN